MTVDKRLQFVILFAFLSHLLVYLHLTERDLLVAAFDGLQPFQRTDHLPVIILRAVELVEKLQHIGACLVGTIEPFIGFDGVGIIFLRHIELSELFLIGRVVRVKCRRLLEVCTCQGVVLHVHIIARQLEIHLRCLRIEVTGMAQKVEGSCQVAHVLLTQSLQIEVIIALQTVLPVGLHRQRSPRQCQDKDHTAHLHDIQ